MAKEKKSFLIHKDSLSVVDELTDDQAGKLLKAIKNYQNGVDLELDQMTKIIFIPFKNQFDRDNEKYKKLCEKNRLIAERRYSEQHSQPLPESTTGNQPLPESTKSTDKDKDKDKDKDTNKQVIDSNESISHEKLVSDAFEYFWDKVWKPCKKKINKIDTSPKKNTFNKKWKVIFNESYFKRNKEEDFRAEINKMADFCKSAHSVDGFNRFQNMQLAKFLNEKQWRDND